MDMMNSGKYRSLVSGLLQALLFLVVFLPTGSVWGLNVKVIALGAFLAAFALYLIAGGNVVSRGDAVFLTVVGAALCFWSLVGILWGHADSSQTLSQLREIASTIFIAWLGITCVRRGIIRAEKLITSVIYGLFAMVCVKLAAIAAMYVYGTNPTQAIESVFGEGSLVGADLVFGLVRIQFPQDLLAPFGLFALLAPRVSGVRFSRVSTLIISVFLLTTCFLAYSRYVWLAFAFAVIAAAVVQKRWKLVTAMVLGVLLLGAWFDDVFRGIYEERFSSVAVDISDEGRVEQTSALIEEAARRPVFGKGMGSHAKAVVRQQAHSYSYEVQWLALLMQFGIVGMIGILLLVAISARDLIMARHPAKPWIVLLFLVWLIASWTNPNLTSSVAGATFGLFMAMFHRLRNTPQSVEPQPARLLATLRQSPGGYA
jgi:hypothetical protein